jgi:alpha-glucosidase
MADFGYDISDFCDIDPRFGTLNDFVALVLYGETRACCDLRGLNS